MEKTPSNILSPFSSLAIFIAFGIVLFQHIFNWVIRILKFYSIYQSFLQSQLDDIFATSNVWAERKNPNSELLNQKISYSDKGDDENLCREDLEMVIEKLGMFCTQENEKLHEKMGLDELSALFDEKEPSLEEVKEAFDVFDENKDGFIDASELQRVLCCLGFPEGLKMEDCKKMIRVFDVNGDDLVDFNEFVKFMENIFC